MPALDIARLPEETDEAWRKRYAAAYYRANKDKWVAALAKVDREQSKATKRVYYQRNREQIKARVAEYQKRNAADLAAKAKQRYEANKDDRKSRNRAYYLANKTKMHEANKRWIAANRDKVKGHKVKWWSANPDKTASYWALRDARERNACPAWVDVKALNKIYREARRLSKATGTKYHVDHIVPIAGKTVCGLHVPWNLRIILGSENVRKSNKLTDEVISLCLSIPRQTSSITA